MHMKIAFIQDLAINESLALADLSSFLKIHGNVCELFIQKSEYYFLKKIIYFNPDLIIVPWDIGAKSWILSVSQRIRNICSCPVLFCGTYPSFYPDKAITCEGIEMICIGETEYAVLELLQSLSKGERRSDIRNIWFNQKDSIIKNELRPLITNLDELPYPDRALYYKYKFIKNLSFKRVTSGRGCSNSCKFCYNPILRKRYESVNYVRRKSVEKIVGELKELKQLGPLKSIHFSDDIFIDGRGWLEEFSLRYPREIALPFTCNATADAINEDVIMLLTKAKCSGIALGIETANEEYRKYILSKPFNNETIMNAARIIKKNKMFLTTFNMVGLPGSNYRDTIETIRLNARIKTDHARVSFAFPLPGTELAKYGIKEGYFSENSIEKILDYTIYPKFVVTNDSNTRINQRLFYLFRVGIKFPRLIPSLEKLKSNHLLKIIEIIDFILNCYGEKRFFSITISSGINYILKAGKITSRTKVFNNFMP